MRREFTIVGGPFDGRTVGVQAVTRQVHAIEYHWLSDDAREENTTTLKIEGDRAIWPEA